MNDQLWPVSAAKTLGATISASSRHSSFVQMAMGTHG